MIRDYWNILPDMNSSSFVQEIPSITIVKAWDMQEKSVTSLKAVKIVMLHDAIDTYVWSDRMYLLFLLSRMSFGNFLSNYWLFQTFLVHWCQWAVNLW